MKSGLGEQLMNLEEYKNNGQLSFLSIAFDVEDAVDRRPCAFDRIGERIIEDEITKSEYDSEIDGQINMFDVYDME